LITSALFNFTHFSLPEPPRKPFFRLLGTAFTESLIEESDAKLVSANVYAYIQDIALISHPKDAGGVDFSFELY
jgi:hypothetical protein